MDHHLKELACRLLKGDKSAFDEVYHLFHKKIFLFCTKYGLSHMDSEEITQEVFVKLWMSRELLDPEKNLQAYIYQIGRNIIIDELKKKVKLQAVREYQMSMIKPTNNVEEDMDYLDLKNLMDKTLLYLPERRREVYELSRNKGLSHKEIAEKLGISTKTVENHLNHAMHNFKAALQNT